MSCRIDVPDGRPRRLDVTAAAVVAQNMRTTPDVETPAAPAPLASTPTAPSRAQELCISATILVGIVSAIGVVVVVFG